MDSSVGTNLANLCMDLLVFVNGCSALVALEVFDVLVVFSRHLDFYSSTFDFKELLFAQGAVVATFEGPVLDALEAKLVLAGVDGRLRRTSGLAQTDGASPF